MKKNALVWAAMLLWGGISSTTAKTYEAIPSESRLTYFLNHPLHRVEGVSKNFTCKVDIPEDTLQTRIAVKAPVLDFNSGNSNRDAHALETLDAFKHPFVEFISDSLRRETEGFRVFGKLTFHGIKRPVDFLMIPKYAADKVRLRGKFKIKLSDFKVERPSLLLVRTDDDLLVEIDVSAKLP